MKYLVTFFSLSFLLLFSCQIKNGKEKIVATEEVPKAVIDYQKILHKGKLTVLAENSSTSYFIYRGKKMGFEYEILKQFAKEIGVELEIKIVKNLDHLISMLNAGEGDIIACNYTVTKERSKEILFSTPFIKASQVLIQRKPDNWSSISEKERNASIIHDPSELAQKEIHVWKNSSYYQRLMHLQEEIGDTIFIEGVDGLIGGEELIQMVSDGIIDYTIVEDNVAKVNQRFYDNIDISCAISFKQNIAFGLRQSSGLLKAKLDKWLRDYMKSRVYRYVKRKYFDIGLASVNAKDDFSSLSGNKISKFDEYFKMAGVKYKRDWRLLASLSYQESKFNPYVESFGGAYGMMQFMPNTGPTYGVYPDSPPPVQIMGGMGKLDADIKFWKRIDDTIQQQKFALGSYNAGRGHILDARRLARKHGLNPDVWENNVEKMILGLSKQEYYNDEVVRHGAMRGGITYNYVKSVYARYLEWKEVYE